MAVHHRHKTDSETNPSRLFFDPKEKDFSFRPLVSLLEMDDNVKWIWRKHVNISLKKSI